MNDVLFGESRMQVIGVTEKSVGGSAFAIHGKHSEALTNEAFKGDPTCVIKLRL